MSAPQTSRTALLDRPVASDTFERVDTWVFDLDNTLYPGACNLFAEVDQRMSAFIAKYLGVPLPHARHLQKSYYRQFGTTLAGMMKVHKMDPAAFLDYVHEIDLTPVPENQALRNAINALPGRKLIFTAGSRRHAENVAGKIGILDLFDDIMDIVDTAYTPKEKAEAYDHLVSRHAVKPQTSAMFEDMPHNLAPAKAIGMSTVLVHSAYMDHPIQRKMRSWTELPPHVDHMTDDLDAFLELVLKALDSESQTKTPDPAA
ncbi:MAG: pyrimidine 5'-nucleotidase [Pseudomonadota bacterium]